jgi:periplasmic protein TonB
MFPYRQIHLNSRVRILIAAILAIVFHAGLINLEFRQKPVWVPGVSFPRAVNVFLGQQKAGGRKHELPRKEFVKEVMKSEILPREPNPELPVKSAPKNLIPEDKKVRIQQSRVIEDSKATKTTDVAPEVDVSTIEKITQNHPESISNTEESRPEAGKGADDMVRENNHDDPSQTSDDVAGQQKVGTVQMAYPNYRLSALPPYPAMARKRAMEGTVMLQVLVNKDGQVDDLEIETSSGFSLLDRAALTAVRKWRFEPGRQGEKKIQMWVRVPVTFKLKN